MPCDPTAPELARSAVASVCEIAVRDTRPVAEGRPHTAVPGDRWYGLLIVQGLSRGWGVTPYAGGKTVWALLDAAPVLI